MHQPVRVLHVLDTLSRGSGVAAVVMNLARNMDHTQFVFDVAVFAGDDENLTTEINHLGGRVYCLPPVSRPVESRRAFSRLLRQQSAQIVHLHAPNAAFLYLSAAKSIGIPHRIVHAHNTAGSDRLLRHMRNRLLESGVPRWADHYLACSDLAADYLFRTHSARRRAVILPNAVDTERYRFQPGVREEIRREWGLPPDTACVGHVGRFVPQKNHAFLLEAFERFLSRRPDSMLLLAGDGPLRREVEQQANAMGIGSRVRFLGVRSDAWRLYQGFDLFALPSLFEGWPVVGAEAQCAGLPCLFSDRITATAALTGGNRFLPIGDPDKWGSAMGLALDGFSREDGSAALRERGFDIRYQAGVLAGLYQEMLQNKGEKGDRR